MREIIMQRIAKDQENFNRSKYVWWKDFALELLDRLANSEVAMQHFSHEAKEAGVLREKMTAFENALLIRKEEIEVLKSRMERMKESAEMREMRKRKQVARLLDKLRYYHRRRQKRAREYKAQLAAGTRTRKKKVAPPAEPVVPVVDESCEPGEEGGSDASVQ